MLLATGIVNDYQSSLVKCLPQMEVCVGSSGYEHS